MLKSFENPGYSVGNSKARSARRNYQKARVCRMLTWLDFM